MSTTTKSRIQICVFSAVSALAGSIFTGVAMADQGNMIAARQSLHQAYNHLRDAEPDKGGHRTNAMNLVNQAIGEINAGIQYANQHGHG